MTRIKRETPPPEMRWQRGDGLDGDEMLAVGAAPDFLPQRAANVNARRRPSGEARHARRLG
jgi:hypothetical protein